MPRAVFAALAGGCLLVLGLEASAVARSVRQLPFMDAARDTRLLADEAHAPTVLVVARVDESESADH
ncbi:MAG: hypothetical protein WD226_00150 [Planctomycetota bacterium]